MPCRTRGVGFPSARVNQIDRGAVTVRTVAWVPEAEVRPWHEAAESAGSWLRRQASEHGDRLGAVTPAIQDYGIPDVDRLGWKTSRRSGRRRVPGGPLGVLAYVPDWESLEFAWVSRSISQALPRAGGGA